MDARPVIIALDYDDIQLAKQFVKQLNPENCRLKVGKEMFTLFGPDWVKYLVDLGFDVFLDLKFHDIPNTVAKAITAAAKLKVWMVNVHASGGHEMIKAAKHACLASESKPLLTAVTILTSMDKAQFVPIYGQQDIAKKVLDLATIANQSGADGVVCSAQEASLLRENFNQQFKLVTPGIRPVGSDVGDQKRITTPAKAKLLGVDFMVIGRPITQASDPVNALNQILQSL
ncbi:orotidine-5'-phosphate decarboxylase [Glaciecola petra]|uniref:Orotidine 5'-phosphate decarboxylase n=1 Tax=Glaciecola petra TaxID=3075602 RepID=A0ABU2ZPJ8_9ALTE|nr:orotidine-5'-phosphate decarboxylase [Aestuariibacter sp. P117]MDT0594279.1 orotidine-5'-phosphate decarboxylase [Aestuariibacter sp. P117]